MPDKQVPKSGYDPRSIFNTIAYNRMGKKIMVKGKDGAFSESDTVEANLLYDILEELRDGKSKK